MKVTTISTTVINLSSTERARLEPTGSIADFLKGKEQQAVGEPSAFVILLRTERFFSRVWLQHWAP